jgi:hypothetical protein
MNSEILAPETTFPPDNNAPLLSLKEYENSGVTVYA